MTAYRMASQVDDVKPDRSLRQRVFSAGAWTLGSYGVDTFVRFLSNLILTRLLFPEAFGAIAAATALIAGLVLISDFGVRTIVIQSARGDQVGFLRSAWMFQVCRGMAVWIVLAACCLLISTRAVRELLPTASVFADRELPLISAIIGLNVVMNAAESTSVSLNIRRLNYRPVMILDFLGKILTVPIIIIWAWVAPSVWAIVGGTVAGAFIRLVLSHLIVPGPWMGRNWDKDHFHEIVRFGRWIIVSSFATFIGQQCDVILLGLLTPASILGLYSIAKLLAGTGEGLLDRLNTSLALPIFGEVIRQDPRNLRNCYYRFRLPIELTAGLLSGTLFVAGDFIVRFLYDSRYAQSGRMLQILALGTLSYPFSIIANAFTATGDTHITALSSITKATSLLACVTIGFLAFGIMGAIGGVALHRIIPSVLIVILAQRRGWIWIWHELRIIPAFIGGLVIGKTLVLISSALDLHNIHQILHFSR